MSTESNFSFTTKVNGDLLTVRGDTVAEFKGNLDGLLAQAAAVAPALAHLQAYGAAVPLTGPGPTPPAPWDAPDAQPTYEQPAQSYPVQQPAQPTPSYPQQPGAQQGAPPLCDHGQPMKLVPAGISKASGKPYAAFYACGQPRGQQCAKKTSVG